MSAKRDYYEVLQVARKASSGDISTAYRKLAVKFHPDKNPGDQEALNCFKEASEAFEVLQDAEKRARYDRFGHAGVNGGSGAGHFTDVEDIFSAFGDIFGDLFGSRTRRRGQADPRPGPEEGCRTARRGQEAPEEARRRGVIRASP